MNASGVLSAEVSMPEIQTQPDKAHRSLIDFDGWAQLAQSDPAAFEEKRARLIEETIQRMPEHKQQRLRCLQWKVDQVRSQCSTPMSACIKLSEMMWDSLVGPGGLKDALERLGTGTAEPLPKAQVLSFRPARRV
jgi:hypothetical protein